MTQFDPEMMRKFRALFTADSGPQQATSQDVRERMLNMPVSHQPPRTMEPLDAPQAPAPGPTHEDDVLSQLPGGTWAYDQGVYQQLKPDGGAPSQMLGEDEAQKYLSFLREGYDAPPLPNGGIGLEMSPDDNAWYDRQAERGDEMLGDMDEDERKRRAALASMGDM